MLLKAGEIDQDYYNFLYYLPKYDREVEVGKLHYKNPNISNIISEQLRYYRKLFFEANNLQEEEIVRMMYAMEIVQSRVPNYQEYYEQTYNTSLDNQDMTSIREEYRLEFLSETNKIFFNNLAYRMANEENITLEDIFALMTIYEADLNYHIKFNQAASLDKSQTFLQEFNEMQTIFLSTIAAANNMEYEDILNLYNEYHLFANVNGKTVINATFNWLNESQQDWLFKKATGERISFTKTINLIVSETLNKSNSK